MEPYVKGISDVNARHFSYFVHCPVSVQRETAPSVIQMPFLYVRAPSWFRVAVGVFRSRILFLFRDVFLLPCLIRIKKMTVRHAFGEVWSNCFSYFAHRDRVRRLKGLRMAYLN